MPTEVIPYTKQGQTLDKDLYIIDDKEKKRKYRHVVDNFYNEAKEARKDGVTPPSPIFARIGDDSLEDISKLAARFDVAVCPLKLRKEPKNIGP